VDDIRAERKSELDNYEESHKQLEANAIARQRAFEEDGNKVFDSVLQEEAKNLLAYQLKEGEGAEEWNQSVESRVNLARGVYSGESTAQEVARASLWAAAAPAYKELLDKQIELNRRLNAQIKGVDEANPTVDTGDGKSSKGEERTFIEMFGEHSGYDVAS